MRLSAFYGCSAAKMCFVYRQVRWRAVLKQVCGKICSGGGKRRAAKGQGIYNLKQIKFLLSKRRYFYSILYRLKVKIKNKYLNLM
jgi:hypothetical protein